MSNAAAPIVVLPVSVDDVALDACLAAVDAGTPAGHARVARRRCACRSARARRHPGLARAHADASALHAPAAHGRRCRASGRSARCLRRCRCGRARTRRAAGARVAHATHRVPGARFGDRHRHAMEQRRRSRRVAARWRDRADARRSRTHRARVRRDGADASRIAGRRRPCRVAARPRAATRGRTGCSELWLVDARR